MKSIAMLLLLSTAAHADCLQWGVTFGGHRVCMVDDLVNRNPVHLIPGPGEGTISATPPPTCDEGWTLVLASGNHPMCAKELKEPH